MRFCLFCSASADSVEDAWPLWITNQFKGKRPAAVRAERAGVRLPSWSVHQPTLKIRCVCEQCNNGWMSRLEGGVQPVLQPLLTGEPGDLDTGGQTAIATWAVKTAMVLEGMDPAEKRGYSQLQRERLRLRATIPWRTSIWLAASTESDWFMSTKNRHTGETPDDISGVSTTMAFAHAVLQVLTIRVPEHVGPGTEVTTEVRQGPWSQLTIQIWPPRAGARWPPPMGLNGEAGLDALAERFRTVDSSRSEIQILAV
jgi:hypothetical protein